MKKRIFNLDELQKVNGGAATVTTVIFDTCVVYKQVLNTVTEICWSGKRVYWFTYNV